MAVIRGVTPVLIGVAVGVATSWLMPQSSTTGDGAEFATPLAGLDRRLARLERTVGNAAVASPHEHCTGAHGPAGDYGRASAVGVTRTHP